MFSSDTFAFSNIFNPVSDAETTDVEGTIFKLQPKFYFLCSQSII